MKSCQIKRYRAWLRAAGIVPAIVVIISGVTFAALQSQDNTLTGNTIATATANLQISTDGVTFTNTQPGFNFNNIVPGGAAMPVAGYPIYLKNAGGTPLTIKMLETKAPTVTGNANLDKVSILVTTVGSGNSAQSFTLNSLLSAVGGETIGTTNLDPGQTQQYKLQASMTADAVNASSASITGVDLLFSGTAVSN